MQGFSFMVPKNLAFLYGKESWNLSKKKRKTKKSIKDIKNALLQYVRRNIKQFDDLIMVAMTRGEEIGIEAKKG